MTDERKTIRVSPREAKAVLEALRALRKNMPGGLDFDEVGKLCERLEGPGPGPDGDPDRQSVRH